VEGPRSTHFLRRSSCSCESGRGAPVSALLTRTFLIRNHRIAFSSSVNLTQQHIIHTVKPIVKLHNLELSAFEDEIPKLGSRFLKIELFGLPLEPAPRSPTSGGVWDLFAGSIQCVAPK
jgi:Gly-Xaa carboxypeptidase